MTLPPVPPSLTQLDDIANAMERKWGIDRLTRLVPPEAQARWVATLEACQGEWTPQADKDAMMMRAWRGMDASATAAGAEPLPPGLWEQRADDGTIVVICRDGEHAQVEILRAKHDGRVVATWTLEEVVRVVLAANGAVINQIKTAFPGATVERQAPKPRLVEDDPVPTLDGNDILTEGAPEAFRDGSALPCLPDPQRASDGPQNEPQGHIGGPPPPTTKRGRKGIAK
jgi:hypothetical protein